MKLVECPRCKGSGCECGCHDPEPIFGIDDSTTHPQYEINIPEKEFEEFLDEMDEE